MKTLLTLLLLTSAAFAQIPNVAGNWTVTAISTVYGGTYPVNGEINQSGGSLSGQMNISGANSCVQSGPFTGTIAANGTMSFTVSQITFSGTVSVNGNSANGTWNTPNTSCARGDGGTWTATRLAPQLTIAQIADGSSWETGFQVVNLDTVPVTFSFTFWGDTGSPMPLPIVNGTAGTFSGSLAVGGTAFAQTPGTSATLLEGWANVTSSGRIGVLTVFRQRISGRPDSEGTVIGVQSGSRVFLPFDNTNGYNTGVAIANTNANQTLSVSILFTADNGAQTTGSLSLGPSAHTAFQVTQPSAFPSLAGVRGSIQFTAPTPDITVVGLRFSPTNSFTSLGEFQ